MIEGGCFGDEEFEQASEYHSRLTQEFLQKVHSNFRDAARELEFDKILLSHLNLAHTPPGKEALARELQPKSDVTLIERSFAETREMRTFLIAEDAPRFAGLSDVGPTLRKLEIEGSTMLSEEGFRLLTAMKAMRGMREFSSRRTDDAPLLWKTASQLFDDKLIERHFDSVFDDAGKIRDSASPEISKIRHDLLRAAETLRAKLLSIVRRLSEDEFAREEIITQREGRFVVPVKVEHKRRVPGFIHSVSQTGQTVFIEPSETLELNNDLRSLEFAEQREIDRILRLLADNIRESIPSLRASLAAAAHLDAVHAKAAYAIRIVAEEPAMIIQNKDSHRHFILTRARHPLLLEKIGREKTVPLTLQLEDKAHTVVLTGPNAGGKTVLLKTVGLLSLMAHAGLLIPAGDDSRMPMLDGIYVEIGDAQSIADDLSTFSSHVTSLVRILRSVTHESFVLLDEIGGGTAPEEGGALGQIILETLTRIGCFTLATTHYGRLAAYAESAEGVMNGSMEFARETLAPTFRFRAGVPGSSHAFDIAERYGMSRNIVERARKLAGAKNSRIDDLTASLEALQQEAILKKTEVERELGAARAAKIEFERKRLEADEIRRTIKKKATGEAEEILKKANQFVERAVREAKEVVKKPTAQEELRSLRARQESERKQLLKEVAATETPAMQNVKIKLEVGSNVKLISSPGQIGKVLSLKGNDVEVEIGSLRMRTKSEQLEIVTGSSAKEKKVERNISQATKYLAEAVEQRIDLRGEYGDDAVIKVDRFLADASAHGLERVEIIHGHGTGALSRRITQHLKGHAFVSSYRFGEPSEGGAGVTIVELQ
ncbi:MAG TPA: endonuclease MutS2 [Candidatus Kapabacteria bacterium]|jgi:DNA mismatch repair protein MutS2